MSFKNVGVSDADVNRKPTIVSRIEVAAIKAVYYFFTGLLVSLVCLSTVLALGVTLALVLSPIWVTVWMLA